MIEWSMMEAHAGMLIESLLVIIIFRGNSP